MPSLDGAFCGVGVAIDDLKVWQAPKMVAVLVFNAQRNTGPLACYEENGEGGRTSDLSISMFFFFSLFTPFFTFLIRLFAVFDPFSFLAIASSCAAR
jgi:hypothetical protein